MDGCTKGLRIQENARHFGTRNSISCFWPRSSRESLASFKLPPDGQIRGSPDGETRSKEAREPLIGARVFISRGHSLTPAWWAFIWPAMTITITTRRDSRRRARLARVGDR